MKCIYFNPVCHKTKKQSKDTVVLPINNIKYFLIDDDDKTVHIIFKKASSLQGELSMASKQELKKILKQIIEI
jgi:hypothetical protein